MKAISTNVKWHAGLPIYASDAFLRTVSDEYGWVGGTDERGSLRCILPYTVIRKAGLAMVRFRLAVVPLDNDFQLVHQKSFLKSATDYFRSAGFDIIIPGANSAVFQTYPEGADAAPYGTIIVNLDQPEDFLMKRVHSTFRYNIRRAVREGVQVKEGLEYLDTAFGLVSETLRRSGQPFRKYEDFKSAVLSLGEHVKILVAEQNGVFQGCMVSPFSQHTAYTWYCGSRPEPVIGAMHLLHWEAMCRFRTLGVKHFDFQGVRIDPTKGSKQDGIFNFKSRFGGELIQGYVWKFPLRMIKSSAYGIAIRLFKGGDIVDVERHKLAASIA